MKYSTIGYILGQVLKFEGIFMLLPFLTGMIYHENEAYSYLIIGIICFVLGCLITLKKVKHPQIFNREGFVAVALSWIVLSIFGAIPFVITGEIPSYVDALFETISGFTTTGASILSNVEALTHTSLMWRSFTHWVGGMGVLVFIMSFLPLMGAHRWISHESYESRKPGTFRQQISTTCEGHCKNSVSYLFGHYDH